MGPLFIGSACLKPGHLFIDGYELLLKEPNRSRFIEATNAAARKVEAAGYRSQIGLRGDDYVPFFLECMNSECRRIRVELKYSREKGSDRCYFRW